MNARVVLPVVLAMSVPAGIAWSLSTSTHAPADGAETGATDLEPGHVLVLAAWKCSYPRLDHVTDLALSLVEEPLNQAVEEGKLLGWGQMNGTIRDEFNYVTYYLARSIEDYHSAFGPLISYMGRERRTELEEFYSLCGETEQMTLTVMTTRP